MRQIIYAWDYIEWGGAQIYYFALMKEAKKHYPITAVIPENSSERIFDSFKALGVNYELLPLREASTKASGIAEKLRLHKRKLSYENALLKQLSKRHDLSESIVHIDMGFWQSLATLARLSLKTNVFVTVHTGLPAENSLRERSWKIKGRIISGFKNFRVIASNEDAKRSLSRYLTPEKVDGIRIAYSGINTGEIEGILAMQPDRKQLCERYGLNGGMFLIFSVGQFIERKGCWTVLESLKKLRQSSTEFFFVWLGTSELDAETKRKIEDYDLSDMFRFLSSAEIGNRGDLLSLLSIAELFVLPSFQEGLPIALVEAMALGKPCIASKVNAIPEAIENMKSGLLIEPGNPQILADSILKLSKDDNLRKLLAVEGQKKAFADFNEKSAADVTLKMYAEAFA